jgi:hypothetical protein
MAVKRHFFLWDLLTQSRCCPWCGAADVHPSSHPLRLLTVFRCETWRCHRCGRRFPLRPGQEEAMPVVVPIERRRRPAGEELYSLDQTLASLLRPDSVDVAAAPESRTPSPPEHVAPPRRRSDDQG